MKTYGIFNCIFVYVPVPHGEDLPVANIPVVSLLEEHVSLNAGDNEDQRAICL